MKRIGITTTVPLEVLIAAGYAPVDLNNILVSAPDPTHYITVAERAGFPLNCCAWIKGIYGICIEQGLKNVLCVTSGDCSNTIMLMEVLKMKGVKALPFAFPDKPDAAAMKEALQQLSGMMGTNLKAAEKIRDSLASARTLALKLDTMTWRDNKVKGWENHLWLISTSDFNGDVLTFRKDLQKIVEECASRTPFPAAETRLAYIGVPSVFAKELYPYVEKLGARVVFNEVQRQFAMPDPGKSLAEQYSNYTYPYSLHERISDIKQQIVKRRVQGVIHYVQAFCHRGIGDIVLRNAIGLPVLTLEGNADFSLNGHVKTRIEAFLDIIQRKKKHTKT